MNETKKSESILYLQLGGGSSDISASSFFILKKKKTIC